MKVAGGGSGIGVKGAGGGSGDVGYAREGESSPSRLLLQKLCARTYVGVWPDLSHTTLNQLPLYIYSSNQLSPTHTRTHSSIHPSFTHTQTLTARHGVWMSPFWTPWCGTA